MKRLLIFAFAVFVALPAHAAAPLVCYSPDEAEAEQGLRLQNEMMMIGMSCGQADGYRAFAVKHADLWQEYEERLGSFFKTKGNYKNSAKWVNDLKVRIGNESALRMGQVSQPIYCRMHKSTFAELKDKTNEQLRVKLRLAADTSLSHPRCKE